MKKIYTCCLVAVLFGGGFSSVFGQTVGSGSGGFPSSMPSPSPPANSAPSAPGPAGYGDGRLAIGAADVSQGGTSNSGEMGTEYPTLAPHVSPAPSPIPDNSRSQGQAPVVASPLPDSDPDLRGVLASDHPLVNVIKMERPADSVIEGKPLYLHELLKGAYSSKTRQLLVKEYWNLTEKYLIYKYRLMQYALLLNHLYPNYQSDPNLEPQLDSAIRMVDGERKAAELEFIQAQYHFSEFVRLYSGFVVSGDRNPTGLFIPVDVPLAMQYNTRSDHLRLVSVRARLLDKTIPLQFQVIQNRQEAFQASESCLQAVINGGESPISPLAMCIDEQIELLHAIIEYNRQIVDYVSETVGGEVSGKQYLSTILYLQNPPGDTLPNTVSVSGSGQRKTFHADQSDIIQAHSVSEDYVTSELSPISHAGYVQQ